MRFDKFLKRSAEPIPVSKDETKRRGPGRPRKPDSELKYPRRLDHRHGPDGRLLKKYVKKPRLAGRYHPASKAKTRRARDKRHYATRRLQQKAYRDSLKRKYYQHRSIATLAAKRHAQDPAWWYQLTYAEFVLIWETAPAVFKEDESRLVAAKDLIDNPLKRKYQCTYLDRLDRTKPFTRENVKVFYRGKPL